MSTVAQIASPPGAAELARRAMRLMAARQLAPTPTNYRRAWLEVGGIDEADEAAGPGSAGEDSPGACRQDGGVQADWSGLIGRLVEALDTTMAGWTPARKREGLRRVLASSPDSSTLAERVDKLVCSWSRPWGELTELLPADAGPEAPPSPASTATDAELGDELAALAVQICESLAGIARAQQWSQTLVDTIRSALTRPLRVEAVNVATRMLRHVYADQSDLADSRLASADALNKALLQWRGWIIDLDRTAERFAKKLDTHANRVGQCSGVEDARRIVEAVVLETGALRGEIATTRDRFERASTRAEALHERVTQLEARLADASRQMLVDDLTGAFNRRGLERQYGRLERECRLRGRPLALAMIDIDDFKRLNDELGHQAGDSALRHLCVELREGLGADGLVSRYGGEEFVLLLAGSALDAAAGCLAELQARLTRTPLSIGKDSRVIRFSGGVTVRAATDTLETMLERVDEALYRAKRAGKNCIRRA